MVVLKDEYRGDILEIRTDERYEKFDTNVEPQERWQYFYDIGFDWAFYVS